MNYEKDDPSRTNGTDANRDPITGAPGSHPVGTGVGAVVGGAAAGAAAGTVVGPVGTVVGAAVGAIVGGLAGKGVAELIDPTREVAYWRDNFKGRPYAENATSFDDVEADLSRDWDGARGASKLQWDQARNATRDAWDRIHNR